MKVAASHFRPAALRRLSLVPVVALAFAAGRWTRDAASLAADPAGDPTVISPAPDKAGKAVSLPKGEVLLLEFLKAFADFSGEEVCLAGNVSPQEKITLERVPAKLTAAAVEPILAGSNLSLTRADFRGKELYWVQKKLPRERKVGRLVRRAEDETTGEKPEGDEKVGGERTAKKAAATSASGPRLFQQSEGGTFLVILETSSRRDAEEAVSLLRAHQEAARR
jgi:hypothetical protein